MPSESPNLKQLLVDEFRRRNRDISKNVGLIICGESNIVRTERTDRSIRSERRPIKDDFGILKVLKKNRTKVIINNWHTYARRPECGWKRAALSKDGRFTISVWNTWKNQIRGEAKNPWSAYSSGKNISSSIREIPRPIPQRPDIRIGVLEVLD